MCSVTQQPQQCGLTLALFSIASQSVGNGKVNTYITFANMMEVSTKQNKAWLRISPQHLRIIAFSGDK